MVISVAVSAICADDIVFSPAQAFITLQMNVASSAKQEEVKKPKIIVRLNIPASKKKTKVHEASNLHTCISSFQAEACALCCMGCLRFAVLMC